MSDNKKEDEPEPESNKTRVCVYDTEREDWKWIDANDVIKNSEVWNK